MSESVVSIAVVGLGMASKPHLATLRQLEGSLHVPVSSRATALLHVWMPPFMQVFLTF